MEFEPAKVEWRWKELGERGRGLLTNLSRALTLTLDAQFQPRVETCILHAQLSTSASPRACVHERYCLRYTNGH